MPKFIALAVELATVKAGRRSSPSGRTGSDARRSTITKHTSSASDSTAMVTVSG